FSGLGWVILLGVLLAVVVLALVLWLQSPARTPPPKTEAGKAAPSLESILNQAEPQAPVLWRQAEAFARNGEHLEAVRSLYLAVPALLHRAGLIRYERTRTNGEYVDQVHLHPEAPPEVHAGFAELTGLFELKWYGERACRAEDWERCRALA